MFTFIISAQKEESDPRRVSVYIFWEPKTQNLKYKLVFFLKYFKIFCNKPTSQHQIPGAERVDAGVASRFVHIAPVHHFLATHREVPKLEYFFQ